MQKVTYNIELDTKIYKPQNDIILKQYDIDSTLFIIKIAEADGTYPLSGSSVEIIFTKPDGTYTMKTQLEENSPLTIVQNDIHCLVPQSALTVIGNVNCEVIIRGAEGEKLTTRRFGFYVDSILLTESVALSDNNVHVLDGLISQVNGLLGDVSENVLVWELWDDTKAYKEGNKVSYQGSSHYCKIPNTSISPTNSTYWTLIASKGEQGDKGEKGDKGNAFVYTDFTQPQLALLKGEKGDTGLTGDTGQRGITGDKGLTGDKGDKGDKGDTGERGLIGLTGDSGADSIVPGPEGPKGEKGDTGAKGEQGLQGEKGDQGDVSLAQLNVVKDDLAEHKLNYGDHLTATMPHQFKDLKNDKTYNFGFQLSGEGKPQIIYEEVI